MNKSHQSKTPTEDNACYATLHKQDQDKPVDLKYSLQIILIYENTISATQQWQYGGLHSW